MPAHRAYGGSLLSFVDIAAVCAHPSGNAALPVVSVVFQQFCQFSKTYFMYMLYFGDLEECGSGFVKTFFFRGVSERLIDFGIFFVFIVFCSAVQFA